MQKHIRITFAAVSCAVLLAAVPARATVTVVEISTSPGATVTIQSTVPPLNYSGGALAGVYNLKVDGVDTDSFCIDLGRYSASTPQPYEVVNLASAPLNPSGPMGALAAKQIKQLWEQYYSSTLSNTDAAALQLAIWKVSAVGAGFTLGWTGTSATIASQATAMYTWVLANPNAPQASLVALVSPTYQNYVIETPDSGMTLTFLGLGMLGVAWLRRDRK